MQRIRAFFSDADGVLTNGTLYINSEGIEVFKTFNSKDGLGIKRFERSGRIFGVITGRNSLPVRARMQELGVVQIHLGVENKLLCLEHLIQDLNLAPNEIAYMGDDENDAEIIQFLNQNGGLTFCPSDSAPEILNIAQIKTSLPGGHGCVREALDLILGI